MDDTASAACDPAQPDTMSGLAAGEVTALARVHSPGSAPLAALEAAGAGRRTMLRDELHAQLIGPPPRFVLISTAGAHP